MNNIPLFPSFSANGLMSISSPTIAFAPRSSASFPISPNNALMLVRFISVMPVKLFNSDLSHVRSGPSFGERRSVKLHWKSTLIMSITASITITMISPTCSCIARSFLHVLYHSLKKPDNTTTVNNTPANSMTCKTLMCACRTSISVYQSFCNSFFRRTI